MGHLHEALRDRVLMDNKLAAAKEDTTLLLGTHTMTWQTNDLRGENAVL